MERLIFDDLIAWKNARKHVPVLLRGARQVGKTYIVEKLGKQEFKYFTNINFEFSPEFARCFRDLNPETIVNSISAITRQPIIAGDSLLFLDEIQQCPQALLSLRYFKEKMPDLHVIAAGSLLEFTINDDQFQMPVGRIKSLYVKPLSFKEYLIANQYSGIIEILQQATVASGIPDAVHEHLIGLLREYFVLGGMPEVVSDYQQDKHLLNVQATQASLMNTYRNDFGKYASKAKHKYLQKIFERAPGMLGERFQYVKVAEDMKSRDLKEALAMLVHAGLVYPIHHTNATGLPLGALINERKFKLLFVDIGLAKSTSLLDPNLLLQQDLMLVNRGALAEQFVGQELLAYYPPYLPGQLFYWEREKKGSSAEVDYVINVGDNILPIEVKAGKTGALRSMQVFLQEKSLKCGIRLSLRPLAFRNNILSIPLYMIHELPRLAQDYL